LPEVKVTSGGKQVQGELTRFGYFEYELPGNAAVKVTWRIKKERVTKPRLLRLKNVNRRLTLRPSRSGVT
jgi:hypothetical protein